jgi:hypothetical protein
MSSVSDAEFSGWIFAYFSGISVVLIKLPTPVGLCTSKKKKYIDLNYIIASMHIQVYLQFAMLPSVIQLNHNVNPGSVSPGQRRFCLLVPEALCMAPNVIFLVLALACFSESKHEGL